jgi:hypothetical protein
MESTGAPPVAPPTEKSGGLAPPSGVDPPAVAPRPDPVFRQFPDATERIAKEWYAAVETTEVWMVTPGGTRGGEANGFFVKSRDLKSAYAKPGKTPTAHPTLPRAAIEKIASDLAFVLGLPVPPAILWHRENAPRGQGRRCCLSLVPFVPVHEWKTIRLNAIVEAQLIPALVDAASGMSVLDTWLDNHDRANLRNLVVSRDPSVLVDGKPLVRAAYLDFSFSMSGPWNAKMERDLAVACCPPGMVPNVQAIDRVVARIEGLDWGVVEQIVQRIPDEYMQAADRDLIVTTLRARRPKLRGIMNGHLGVA